MSDKSNNRIMIWDNVKGILIVLVVIGHFIWDYDRGSTTPIINQIIFTFHMPVFVFTSGYFGKDEYVKNDNLKRVGSFLIMYVVFQLLMYTLFVDFPSEFSLIYPYKTAWYLFALACWRFFAPYLPKKKIVFVFFLILALGVGFFPQIQNTLAIARIIAFFPFYLLGYWIDVKRVSEFISNRGMKEYFTGGAILCLTGYIAYKVCTIFQFSHSALIMSPYSDMFEFLGRIAIFVISGLTIVGMICLIPNRRIWGITTMGKNSLSVYFFHRFVVIGCMAYLPEELSCSTFIMITILGTAFICALFGNDYVGIRIKKLVKWITFSIWEKENIKYFWIGLGIVFGILLVTSYYCNYV